MTAPILALNGAGGTCKPVARRDDTVVTNPYVGTITTGSSTVCAGG